MDEDTHGRARIAPSVRTWEDMWKCGAADRATVREGNTAFTEGRFRAILPQPVVSVQREEVLPTRRYNGRPVEGAVGDCGDQVQALSESMAATAWALPTGSTEGVFSGLGFKAVRNLQDLRTDPVSDGD